MTPAASNDESACSAAHARDIFDIEPFEAVIRRIGTPTFGIGQKVDIIQKLTKFAVKSLLQQQQHAD